ncbi:uncharacterized protein B0H64DRAFT_476674 [Chaetomium fimeti]|uniref:Rhodopsin domain-containing protein n=1 Tax=Chaetomium fimeti TaxID=1854472 RepID=A0AAE0HAP2_9PEZI|nr:hypothetical protein B0H64DRAFT_476674 [Chaetomium fimeti]
MTAIIALASSLGALMFLSAVTITLRIFTKHRRGRPIRKDDYTLIVSCIFLLISLVLIIAATRRGYGQHLSDLKSSPAEAVKLIAVSEFFAVSAGAVAKTAIAMTLLDVLNVRWQRTVTWGLVISANLIILGFATFIWVIVWQDRLVKICIEEVGVWRFAIFGAVKITQMDCKNFELDVTHDTVSLVIWTFAEPVAIIIAASIPVLRQLIEKPSEAAFERGLMGLRSGSGLPHNFSFPSSPRFGQEAKVWSSRSGPVGTFIPLQDLGSMDAILRIDEVQVNNEESNWDSPPKQSPHSRLGIMRVGEFEEDHGREGGGIGGGSWERNWAR